MLLNCEKFLVFGDETKISKLNSRRRQDQTKLGKCSTVQIGNACLPVRYIKIKIKIQRIIILCVVPEGVGLLSRSL
jgi:hypothetical protein